MSKKGLSCLLCGESKATSHFMKHRNDKFSKRLGFCKDCVNKVDVNDQESVIDLFRMMNIPFVEEVWENQFEDGDESTLGKYLKAVATRREYKIFSDSLYGNTNDIESDTKSDVMVTPKMIDRWGSDSSLEEYQALERAYESLEKIKVPSTHQEEMRYVLNVKFKRALDQALDQGETKQVKGLRETYTKDLKELGLDVSSDDDELSLGQRIREWERNLPIPEMGIEFEDVDGIEYYFNKYFTIPMKRVFGQATSQEISELYEMDGDLDGEKE